MGSKNVKHPGLCAQTGQKLQIPWMAASWTARILDGFEEVGAYTLAAHIRLALRVGTLAVGAGGVVAHLTTNVTLFMMRRRRRRSCH
jgi:hypothetical protein